MDQFWKAINTRSSRLFSCACLVVLLVAACQKSAPLTPALTPLPPTLPPTLTHLPPTLRPTLTQLPGGPASIVLGRPFTLGLGQEFVLSEAGLHLRFERVLEDSRCPTLVLCVWVGQAIVEVSVWSDASAPEPLEFSTFSTPPTSTNSHDVKGFTIFLQGVEPYPESPDKPIPEKDYRLILVVTRLK